MAAGLTLLLAPEQAPPTAFAAGIAGPLVGADLLHLSDAEKIASGVVGIGGAGTLDGVVLAGIVAAHLARGFGPRRARLVDPDQCANRATLTTMIGIGKCQGEASMDRKIKAFILKQMKDHDRMTIATVRKDGWPQATTVVYANDGLALYFVCDRDSQKVRNIERCNKVSVTINGDEKDWKRIRGLSLAAIAKPLKKEADIAAALKLLARKFPELADVSAPERAEMAVVKLVPKVVSAIDYRKGFGHADLVRA